MKNRKKGFSLVELLIVLAVMAALIATITPVALNAIKKSKATQVAQNLKTLASALENAAYVNGLSNGLVAGPGGTSAVTIAQLGRDIDDTKYSVAYAQTGGSFTAVIYYIGADADINVVDDILPLATNSATKPDGTYSTTLGSASYTSTDSIYYQITFTVY